MDMMKSLILYDEFGPNMGYESMKAHFFDVPYEGQESVANYLDSMGETTYVAAGRATDVFTGEVINIPYTGKTDGEYSWNSVLSYYVRTYNLKLPKEFEEKALSWAQDDCPEINFDNLVQYEKDISIAKETLKAQLQIPLEKIICELYALPSHQHHTYYAVIYIEDGIYKMAYVTNEFYSPKWDDPIYMYRFAEVKKAMKQENFDGKMIVGEKELSKEFTEMILDIIRGIPKRRQLLTGSGLYLDGVVQGIYVYENARCNHFVWYRDASKIRFDQEKKYLIPIMDELYLKVEEQMFGDS